LDYVLGDGGSEADAAAWVLADPERLPEAYELLADLESLEGELSPARAEDRSGAVARLDGLLRALLEGFAEEDAAQAPAAAPPRRRRPIWVLAAAAGLLVAGSLWWMQSGGAPRLPTQVEVERNQTLAGAAERVDVGAPIPVERGATVKISIAVPAAPRSVTLIVDTLEAPLRARFPEGDGVWSESLGAPGATASRRPGVVEIQLPVRGLRAEAGPVGVELEVDGARAAPLRLEVR